MFFIRSKFYHFEKRPSNKHSLSEFLSESDPVQFDAEPCEATEENKMCQWLASLVWKGKKPTNRKLNAKLENKKFDNLMLRGQ